ncbi:periplasmic protein [Helicobacter mustelae]|uniref:Putative periplasmic protein n=1 Tax=Helicobacter mustelae (strain ATCC 43772 / CCUG 25715 / CIP 103759 / LMG 18044 / NCTC 12198 / R85-136P) TaxID=679897 RepID=D3UHI7_HELM1|nr:periplasmic protein [Helicobacter mustelae]CBG39959.1 Putative periplasmic protein [Helicobacter mustelae 12198]SQH71471.1 periplasmic protein [Helicobacter mustelae]STP12599.1 periplasmic protein [Helicobacter mustelae]
MKNLARGVVVGRICALLLFFGILLAEDGQNFPNIMLELDKSSKNMQDAFLKDNYELIEIRQRQMKAAIKDLKSIPVHYYLNSKTKEFENIVNLRIVRIDEALDLMGKQLQKRKTQDAFETFLSILRECNGCHVIFQGHTGE